MEGDTRDTFMLTLPNGERVRCWKREKVQIWLDVHATGTVYLVKDDVSGVHSRVAPDSGEARFIERGRNT